MVYVQPRICPWEWDAQISLGFWETNRSPNLGQKTKPKDCQQKERTYWKIDFAVPTDHRVKLEESKKRDKHLDLTRKRKKKLWNMKVMVILIVTGALSTVTKGLIKGLEDLEIRGQEETIQTTALLRLGRILRRVQET